MLPLGSVIKIKERKYVIAGYRPMEKDGAVAVGYLLLPYPLGYLNKNGLFLCPAAQVEEVLFEGYQNERAGRFLESVQKLETEGKSADYGEFVGFMNAVKGKLKEQGEG